MKFKLFVASLFLMPSVVLADGTSSGVLTGFVLTPQAGDKVALLITPSVSITTPAACNVTNRFVIDANTAFGKTALSTILAAFHSGEEVRLTGNGSCDASLSSNSEVLRKVCTKDGAC